MAWDTRVAALSNSSISWKAEMIMVATRMLNSTIQENRGKEMTAAKKTKQNKKKNTVT